MILPPLAAATALTQAGFAVVPSLPSSKEIHLKGWPDLHLTLDELPQYFNGADQNVSINWKHSGGRCALDLDAPEAEELAPLLLPLDTPAFGRSGRLRQLIFECPEATSFRLKHDNETLVEVLASGSNSLAPGSTHPEGELVQWCAGRSPDDPPMKIAFARLQRFANIVAGAALLLRYWRAVAGQRVRHDTALKLTGAMLHGGWTPAAVRWVLQAIFFVANDPELNDRMAAVETTIQRQQDGQPFSGLPELAKVMPTVLIEALARFWSLGTANAVPEFSDTFPGAATNGGIGEALLTWACDVVEEKIAWDWYGFLAAGKTTLLAGAPGCGKSTLAMTVAAQYSTGAAFHGSTETRAPKRVLICAAEDGAADTKRPRLVAAGADLTMVAFLDLVQQGAEQRCFTLKHMPELDALLSKHPGEFGLLVIDPIGSYLAGADSHRDSDVRELLRPLGVLAEKHRIAVLIIAHLNKSSGQKAMNRVTGSTAIVAASRLAWLIVKDAQHPSTALMAQMKTNLTEPLDGVAFHIVKETLPSGAETSRTVFDDLPVKLTADELLALDSTKAAPSKKEAEAEQWLAQRLAAGAVAVRTLKEECKEQPFSWATVKRAMKDLGVQGEGENEDRVWKLPSAVTNTVITATEDSNPNAPELIEPVAESAPAPASLEDVPILTV